MALRSKKAALTLLIILVTAFIAVYFWRNDIANQSTRASNAEVGKKSIAITNPESIALKANTSGQQTNHSSSSYVLPSIEKPIDEAFAELKQSADKGESKAACRLAMELLRCQISLKQEEKKLAEALSAPPHPRASAETQHFRDQAALSEFQTYQSCKKIPPENLVDAVTLLEQAANRHELDAMVVWASGMWIRVRHGDSTVYLQDPTFDRWRASAIPMMNEALRRGSLDAAAEWWQAFKYDSGPLFRSLVKNDPKQAHTYFVLTGLILNKPRATPSGLSASDALDSQQAAQKMFQEWFGGRLIHEQSSTSAIMSVYMGGEDQHDFCNPRINR